MKTLRPTAILAALVFGWFASPRAMAHCDTLNGPVVQDARLALTKGDVTPVLKWISAENEDAVRTAFAKTLVVRKQSTAAAELADTYFFETLVRLHRAGEGEPYTGLKAEEPAAGIEAADDAIRHGDGAALTRDLAGRVQAGLNERLQRVLAAKAHADHNVEAGRAYVAAYVEFIHFAEKLYDTTSAGPAAHAHAH